MTTDKTNNPKLLLPIEVARSIYAAMGNRGQELSRDDYRDFLDEFIHAWSTVDKEKVLDKIEILQKLDSEG